MSETTGRRIDVMAHISQSIRRILTTPIGSCIERRDFGSLLPELIDAPLNDTTLMQAVAASASAIARWEPRVRASAIKIVQDAASPSTLTIALYGDRVDDGTDVSLQLPLQLGGLRV